MLLGVLAGVLEFIPLVGPLLLAIVASIVGALHAPVLALWAVGFLGVLRLVQDDVSVAFRHWLAWRGAETVSSEMPV